MRMVKSLLLGSAAGLVAVAGAQAADLPVKAKPVQYVKICSLYGVGFYYIPGTDMCLKIGGWVRAEMAYGVNGQSVGTYSNGVLNNRSTNNNWWRIRGYITADARNQTEYGTLRSYIAVGLSTNTLGVDGASNQFDANRAFIQWAGFTFGRAASFYDFYSGAAVSYFGFFPQSDTGDGGKEVMAYTAQFGNGFSASLSAEVRRTTNIIGQNAGGTSPTAGAVPTFGAAGSLIAGAMTPGGFAATGYGGNQYPDFIANLRVDQAWGSAQIMGGVHQVNGLYYAGPQPAPAGAAGTLAASFGPEGFGHPSDAWGWLVGAGLKWNFPMIGAGDYFYSQVNYTQGALRYLFQNPNGNWYLQENQGSAAYGVLSDGVYGGTNFAGAGTGTDIQLTTAWGINAAYEHFWSPRWRTSIHGGYYAVSYNSQANAILCSVQGFGNGTGIGNLAVATAGCDNNWSTWWIGTRTQWNVTKDFYMGLDVAYTKIQSGSTFNGLTANAPQIAANQMLPGGTNNYQRPVDDQDNWQVRFRVHRDFYP
jgi:porin-like protein